MINNELDFIFVNEGLQSSRYVTSLSDNLYKDYSEMCMRVSSDPNYVFHLASSKDINVIIEYTYKSPTLPNTQLPHGSINLMEINDSYANIQVDEGTSTTVEEFNKNVP